MEKEQRWRKDGGVQQCLTLQDAEKDEAEQTESLNKLL